MMIKSWILNFKHLLFRIIKNRPNPRNRFREIFFFPFQCFSEPTMTGLIFDSTLIENNKISGQASQIMLCPYGTINSELGFDLVPPAQFT